MTIALLLNVASSTSNNGSKNIFPFVWPYPTPIILVPKGKGDHRLGSISCAILLFVRNRSNKTNANDTLKDNVDALLSFNTLTFIY